MIPAEWYGWMHYKTDIPPTVVSDHFFNGQGVLHVHENTSNLKKVLQMI